MPHPAATDRLPHNPLTRSRAFAFVLALSGIASLGCGTGPDERSGGDAGRGDARPAQLDALLYDRVGVDDGDSTDWKSFKLEEGAKVTINVWWDDPKGVSATLELRDLDAKSVAKLKHERGAQKETLGPIKLAEGTYFLRFFASSGASVYSFEVTTGAGDDGGDAVPDL